MWASIQSEVGRASSSTSRAPRVSSALTVSTGTNSPSRSGGKRGGPPFGLMTIWVIGGGEVYRAALADVDRVEATEVDTQLLSADTWFPALDPQRWMASQRQSHAADARHAFAFDFVRWQRIREP